MVRFQRVMAQAPKRRSDCITTKQHTRHLGLSPPGLLRMLQYVDDDDTPCETREGHHANRPPLDRGRAISTI